MFREYRGFLSVCVILGLIYTAFAAATDSGLFALGTHFLGTDRSAQKLAFILSGMVAGAIIAGPLFLLARLFGINIREKPLDPAADEIAEIRKRS